MYDQDFEPTPTHADGAFLPPQRIWQLQGFTHSAHEAPIATEPAWQATMALRLTGSEELLDVVLHPKFRLMPRMALVPIGPCHACGDGALRTAGTLETSIGELLVRACDTCGLVDLDPRLASSH